MPFHVGGHKPNPRDKRFTFAVRHRLLIGGIGVAVIWCGVYRFSHGMFMWMNYLHQPGYASGLIPVGAVVLAVALIPAIEKAAKQLTS